MDATSQAPWPSDEELVAEILSGSHEHFDMLYDAYFQRVFHFALKRLRDRGEAEDVAQEVFMTVLSALSSFRGQSSLLVWIFGITRNSVNRRFRKPRPILEPLEAGGPLDVASKDAPADNVLEARRVLSRCAEIISEDLTEAQKEIFYLRHLRQLSIRAIAETLEKTEDAIKANLYRIRQAIGDKAPGLESMLRT